MSRVIVTGGSGRLGRSVVASLAAAGHAVVSVDRVSAEGVFAEQVEHDLRDADGTTRLFASLKPDAVVHLAAISVPFSAPEREILHTNVSLAFHVLEATVASGADRLLVASSPTVIGYGAPLGWAPTVLPLDEDHPLAPWNAYALSKQVIEEIAAMGVRSAGDRVRFGVFRPCYVIAPDEWQGAPTQQGHTVRERLEQPELSAVALFNYLDARDAGDFVVAWLDRAHDVPNGTCFFVGAADSLAVGSVPELIRTYIPAAADAASSLGETSPVFSSERAARLLGWRPTRSWRTELAGADELDPEVAHG